MPDITAILVHYSDQGSIHHAINSLNHISPRLESIIVVDYQGAPVEVTLRQPVEYINNARDGSGQVLNDMITTCTTPYVLFLHQQDYLSPTSHATQLQLPDEKTILNTRYKRQHTDMYQPLLVSTTLLKETPFLSNAQLPFKEALFPAWLSQIKNVTQLLADGWIKQSRHMSSATVREKEKMLKKYQPTHQTNVSPTLSVLIAHYNMDRYIDTAVASCRLQHGPCEQILIMDDGSTDNAYARLMQWHDGQQINVLRQPNQGKAIALNRLLPKVTSEFILELDADDWLDPNAISVIKTYLRKLPKNVAVLYGNLRKWKQLTHDVLFKEVSKGMTIHHLNELLAYRFPLGPRIYRTSTLKESGGFPVIALAEGRMYEDVSVLMRLIKQSQFCYRDFTVYNVREHEESITKKNDISWGDFLKAHNIH